MSKLVIFRIMRLLLVAIFLFTLPQVASACSFRYSSNGFAAKSIAESVAVFKMDNDRLPENWVEISQYFVAHVDVEFNYVEPSKRYAFLSPSVPYKLSFGQVKVILIMRSPFREEDRRGGVFGLTDRLKEKGRYVIFERADGSVGARYEKEEDIIKAFSAANVPLPEPDSLKGFPHEAEYFGKQIMIIGVLLILLFSLIIGFTAYESSRKRRRSQKLDSFSQ